MFRLTFHLWKVKVQIENEKLYKKEWYKKNSEKIKQRQAERYDPAVRREKYEQQKESQAKISKRILEEENASSDIDEEASGIFSQARNIFCSFYVYKIHETFSSEV